MIIYMMKADTSVELAIVGDNCENVWLKTPSDDVSSPRIEQLAGFLIIFTSTFKRGTKKGKIFDPLMH